MKSRKKTIRKKSGRILSKKRNQRGGEPGNNDFWGFNNSTGSDPKPDHDKFNNFSNKKYQKYFFFDIKKFNFIEYHGCELNDINIYYYHYYHDESKYEFVFFKLPTQMSNINKCFSLDKGVFIPDIIIENESFKMEMETFKYVEINITLKDPDVFAGFGNLFNGGARSIHNKKLKKKGNKLKTIRKKYNNRTHLRRKNNKLLKNQQIMRGGLRRNISAKDQEKIDMIKTNKFKTQIYKINIVDEQRLLYELTEKAYPNNKKILKFFVNDYEHIDLFRNSLIQVELYQEYPDEICEIEEFGYFKKEEIIPYELLRNRPLTNQNFYDLREKRPKYFYIIMPKYDYNLLEYFSEFTINNDTIKYLLYQIFLVLNILRKKKIVHYDIKFENFMINSSEKKVKLIDFELAEYYDVPSFKIKQSGSEEYLHPCLKNISEYTSDIIKEYMYFIDYYSFIKNIKMHLRHIYNKIPNLETLFKSAEKFNPRSEKKFDVNLKVIMTYLQKYDINTEILEHKIRDDQNFLNQTQFRKLFPSISIYNKYLLYEIRGIKFVIFDNKDVYLYKTLTKNTITYHVLYDYIHKKTILFEDSGETIKIVQPNKIEEIIKIEITII